MRQESLMQVSGSFLESRNAKIDAPAVCTARTYTDLSFKRKAYTDYAMLNAEMKRLEMPDLAD